MVGKYGAARTTSPTISLTGVSGKNDVRGKAASDAKRHVAAVVTAAPESGATIERASDVNDHHDVVESTEAGQMVRGPERHAARAMTAPMKPCIVDKPRTPMAQQPDEKLLWQRFPRQG